MSEDLFAAFSTNEALGNHSKAPKNPDNGGLIYDHENSQEANKVLQDDDDDDDDFGDFEDATASPTAALEHPSSAPVEVTGAKSRNVSHKSDEAADSRLGRHPFADHMDFLFSGGDGEYDAGADDLDDLSRNPEAAMAFSKRLIATRDREHNMPTTSPNLDTVTNSIQGLEARTTSQKELKEPSKSSTIHDPNVLFDADEALRYQATQSEDDDFGDFEEGSHAEPQALASEPYKSNVDLLGSIDAPVPEPTKNTKTAPASTARLTASSSKSHVNSDLAIADDPWDDFEDAEPIHASHEAHMGSQPQASNLAKPKATDSDADGGLPPTNVPPPGILLSVFPQIFTTAQDTLLEPVSKMAPSQKQVLIKNPATSQFLRKHINFIVVLGHILAGRKLRWKRDQYLSQSMRIGPAGAGGKSGMKLTSVDKGELMKEDREALDIVRLWKVHVGRLRSVVAAAKSHGITLPTLPEIAEKLPVQTLKALEGGFVAPHACALCGLKREERVAKVDINIDDSFGEWWVQSMSMHVVCRQFWIENKDKLKSR